MIPIPKPKPVDQKIPSHQSEEEEKDYLQKILERQAHRLTDAIDRVSSLI